MPVYRYKQSGLNIEAVKRQVPPADASSVSGSATAADLYWDITAPTTSKDDLDGYMASVGWTFVETDPSNTPSEAAAGNISHANLGSVTANQHHNEDHASRHGPAGGDALKLDDLAAPDDNTDLNASLSAHGLIPKLGGGTNNYFRADGTWNAPPGTAVFGTQWNYNESTDESSSSNDTWIQKVRLTLSSLPLGDYLVLFALVARVSTTNVVVGMRIEEDDTTELCSATVRPGATDADQPCMQFARLSSYSGSHTLDLEFNRTSSSGTAYVRQAKLALFRVA